MLIPPNKSNSYPVVILSTQELVSQMEICSFIYLSCFSDPGSGGLVNHACSNVCPCVHFHMPETSFPQSLFISFCWNYAQWYKSMSRKKWWKWNFWKILLFPKSVKTAQNGTKVELPWVFKKNYYFLLEVF